MASILGMGIVLFIMAYFIFQLRNADNSLSEGRANHFILQLILIFFLFAGLLILSSAVLQESQNCEWLKDNTTIINASLTTEQYSFTCNETSSPANNFYKSVAWLLRLFGLYLFGYFVYEVLRYFGFIVEKIR